VLIEAQNETPDQDAFDLFGPCRRRRGERILEGLLVVALLLRRDRVFLLALSTLPGLAPAPPPPELTFTMLPTMSTPAPARLTVEPPDFNVTALEPSRMMLAAFKVILPAPRSTRRRRPSR
jgi:hypothetical protein